MLAKCYFFKADSSSKVTVSGGLSWKRGAKDTKGTVKLIDRKQTDNAMAQKYKYKQTNYSSQNTIKKTKLSNTNPTKNLGWTRDPMGNTYKCLVLENKLEWNQKLNKFSYEVMTKCCYFEDGQLSKMVASTGLSLT